MLIIFLSSFTFAYHNMYGICIEETLAQLEHISWILVHLLHLVHVRNNTPFVFGGTKDAKNVYEDTFLEWGCQYYFVVVCSSTFLFVCWKLCLVVWRCDTRYSSRSTLKCSSIVYNIHSKYSKNYCFFQKDAILVSVL